MNPRVLLLSSAAVAGFALGAFSVTRLEERAGSPARLSMSTAHRQAIRAGETAEDALAEALTALQMGGDLRAIARLGSALGELGVAQMQRLLEYRAR